MDQVKVKACDHRQGVVFSIGAGSLTSGGRTDVANAEVDLKIRLSSFHQTDVISFDERARLYIPSLVHPVGPPVVTIDWPDMRTIELGDQFYRDVWEAAWNGARVSVSCEAGHGRTGTFLCRLLGHIGAGTLAWVRENYCHRAVETYAQIAYLRDKGLVYPTDKGSHVDLFPKDKRGIAGWYSDSAKRYTDPRDRDHKARGYGAYDPSGEWTSADDAMLQRKLEAWERGKQ